MNKITSEKIRSLRKEFWEDPKRNHKFLPPDKLIPTHGDTTAMFTLAGMQQLVPFLMGKPHPLGKRLYNIQKCLRTNDIEEVGDERHLTFFEMMGNWSLGDYFKEEAIKWSKQFLVDYLKIPLDKLGATVFKGEDNIPEDKQSFQIWEKNGIDKNKIKKLGKEDNFRGPAGEVGPCGPCTEIYFDRGDIWGENDWNLGINDRYIEIWNDVFMEFYKNKDGNYNKLSQQNVDTGMGLERLTMIIQGVPTVFETDLFKPIIEIISKYVEKKYPLQDYFFDVVDNKKYTKQEILKLNELEVTKRFRIIADHIRAAVFLIGDGLIPSNEGRGYVLRRLIRRLYYNLILLNEKIDNNIVSKFIEEIVEVIANKYGLYRKEVLEEKENIKKVLIEEIFKFDKTIRKGLDILKKEIKKIEGKILPGDVVFRLYDTYGFPVELTEEIANLYGFKIDIHGFKKLMEKAKEKSRQSTKEIFKRGIDWSKYIKGLPQTEFVGYERLEIDNPKLLKDFYVDIDGKKQRILIFDKTPFYAEGGGQTGDKGEIILDNGEKLKIKDVQKYAGVYLHFVE